ncbi:hypothetical protein LS66_009750 [Helicobacter sp. MIT 03-1614]|uniref:Uncharacterized protein n=1 Tax=Helicobacter typhlonius TaxID=76936 RepID=A0A099UFH5_9HELI|nr:MULTISPECIES: hypothetical protein [Helicobacter]TLD77818.1 hypothetical protein LS75_009315 [Helicobacter typhlonius]TLD86134.1 hypothetical protein LS66_009750 [Helicobacter sp. MIT 03-1614]CUU39636.1 Hypothetical protein BN2458_PEG0750 [Helicobacter typhlonius]
MSRESDKIESQRKNVISENLRVNTESKKLDSNNDEIIWELERKKNFLICLNIFWSYFVRCGIIGFCLLGHKEEFELFYNRFFSLYARNGILCKG